MEDMMVDAAGNLQIASMFAEYFLVWVSVCPILRHLRVDTEMT